MGVQNELDKSHRTSNRNRRNSYFAFIPVFNWREKRNHQNERNIIKIIRKSDMCKSNPILKALLIENVRIFCIVIETSGKRSGKIICASAPYILSLVSKANPKLGNMLKSERISSYLSVLEQSDLESLVSHVYEATIIIHGGVKRFYPLLRVSLLRDFFWSSEKFIMYLLNHGLYVLQSCVELFYDNVRPFIYYICRQNYELASYIADYIPQLIASSLKSSIVISAYSKKAVIFIFQFVRKIVSFLSDVVKHISRDSSLNIMAKKISLYLKACMTYLRSTDSCRRIEEKLYHLVSVYKPYILKYLQQSFIVIRDFIQSRIPLLKDTLQYIFKEGVELLRNFIDDNLVDILNVYNSLKAFLSENRHRITSVCCSSCHYFYTCLVYLFKTFQAILPHIIQLSSNGIITFITCSNVALDYCVHLCGLASSFITFILENHKELFRHVSDSCFSIFKNVYKVLIKMQPYMVLILRIIFNELTKLTHALAPTSLACLQEMNSSLFHASKEVVSKSCLAAKRILPSFYYTAKAVVPPTVRAAQEVIKSSTKSIVVVYPTIFRGILTIRPKLEEGFIVLFTDGNKACLEVMSVTFSASCELKDVAFTVSSNFPVCYKAFSEVLSTTSHAAFEVTVTTIRAKTRMLKDIKRAHDIVHTSLLLAEQEITAVYMDAIFEINSILPNSSKKYLIFDGNTSFIKKYVINFPYNQFVKSLRAMNGFSKYSVNATPNVSGNAVLYLQDFVKVVAYVHSCTFSFAYSMSVLILPQRVYKDLNAAFVSSFNHTYRKAKLKMTPHIANLSSKMGNTLSDITNKIVHSFCDSLSKAWYTLKFSVQTSWDAACHFVPEAWTVFEYRTSAFWEFCVENVPFLWLAWKNFCSALWKIIYDLAPHVWQYSSSAVPVVWTSVRALVKKFWIYWIDFSRLMWQYFTSLSSKYWMLSNTYLPSIWFTGCSKTRKGWNLSCLLIENCWAFSVENCLISWQFLHDSVAKSWKSSLAFTKSTYCVLATTSSVLQKGFCLCLKSKNRICVIFKATPRINDLSQACIDLPKLRNMLQLTGIRNCPETDTTDNPSTQLPLSSGINSCICSVINFIHKIDKMLNFEVFIPSFRKKSGEKILSQNIIRN